MPFAFFYIFTAWILLETYGHYDGPFAIILAGGFGLTLLAALLSGARDLVRGFTRIGADKNKLSGLNPYTQTYADLYNGGYDYAPGLNYWPGYYFWSAPFRLLGDIRLGSVVADAVTAVLLLKLTAKFGADESLQYLMVLSWLSFPVSLFVLEQAWIEPVIVMLMTGLLWCGLTKRWVAAGILLGILSGMKQHMLLLSALTLCYFYRHCARREFYKVLGWASATFTVTVALFLLVSGQAFIQQTIVTYFQRETRLDSLSLTAYLANEHGLIANNYLLITIYLIALLVSLALILRANPVTWSHWPAALFVSYGVLFLAGKQAFCNYYYLLAFIALLASFISSPASALEAPTGADASLEEFPAPSPPAHARRAQSGCRAQRRLSLAQWTDWLHS